MTPLESGTLAKRAAQVHLGSLLVLWAALTFSTALVEISFMTALVSWLFLKISRRNPDLPRDKALWVLLSGYVVCVLISAIFSEIPELSVRGCLKVLQSVAIMLMTCDAFGSPENHRYFKKAFLLVFVITLSDALFQSFSGVDFIRGFRAEASRAGFRVTGAFKSYGLFAAFMIMTVPYLGGILFSKVKERAPSGKILFYGLLMLVGIALLFLTRSRGAILAFFGSLLLLAALRQHWKLLTGVFLLSVITLAFLPREMIIHLDADGREQSIVERFYLWDRALQVIKARPLFGTGINTYDQAHQKYDTRKNWRVTEYYAHNGYLQTAAEIGLPGLLFLLAFLGRYLIYSLHQIRRLPDRLAAPQWGLLTALTAFLLMAGVDTIMHNGQPVMTFFYLLGVNLAGFRLKIS